jgi:methylenetetrahydrofolate reductase (NADPH)
MTDSAESSSRADASSLRLSFEFFPPRSANGQDSLGRVAQRLGELNPDFYSCTYGAGGSTREGTKDTVTRLIQTGLAAAPHLSIGGDNRADTFSLLDYYRDIGVKRIVALRGDLPSGIGRARFSHNAETLVGWIRDHSADHFHLEVAAYPETHPDAKSPAADLAFFKSKVDAGADSAITQYFYNPNAYYDFVDRCATAGIQIPIYPGIMPITNYDGLIRFSDNCGADVPRWIRKHLQAFGEDEAGLKEFGVEVVTRLCEDLLAAGAPGLHFYTLNRWGASRTICHNLGLSARAA